ncbi:MAG TPA: NAD-dependent epimerase/dehydratase family protein [Gammaproteobacteria bacterium]|nr:NAD-dependent epimerase/dehydratase family protein [Gammaproteobacteria bacterium]
MRVLVTGGSSVVGDYLLPRLARAGHEVTVLSRRPHPDSAWHQADVARDPVWDAALEDTQALIHLAPLPLLPRLLRDAPAGLRRVVAIGTTSVYTKVDSASHRERELVRHQREAEQGMIGSCGARGMVYTLLRPTLVYDGRRDKNVARIAALIRRIGFFPLAWPGRGMRQPLHADDLAAACVAALTLPQSGAYEIAGGETLSYRAMLERIFRALGREPRILPVPVFLYRAAIATARLLPRYRALTPEVAERMNRDMVFDCAATEQALGIRPRPFTPEPMP